MIIRFSAEFTPYTNGLPEIDVPCSKLGEGLLKMFELFPQLYVRLMADKCDIAQKSVFQFNDEYIWEMEENLREVTDTDVLLLSMDLPTGEKKFVGIIFNVAMIVVGVVLVATGVGAAFGVSLIISGVYGLTVSVLAFIEANNLPTPNALGSLSNSAAYTFTGIRNTTASGTPFQMVYGEHRIGGQVLNMYTAFETADSAAGAVTNSLLYVQLGLSEGEIQSVGDIEIDQLPLSYYNAVTTAPDLDYFRTGTSNQAPMPAFSRIENATSYNRKVVSL